MYGVRNDPRGYQRPILMTSVQYAIGWGQPREAEDSVSSRLFLPESQIQWDNQGRCRDFLGGAVVKNPPANAGDTGSSPGPGRSHMPRSN